MDRKKTGNQAQVKIPEKQGLTEADIRDLREVFKLFDFKGTGKVNPKEVRDLLFSTGIQKKSQTMAQVAESLGKTNQDLTLEEFVDACQASFADRYSRNALSEIFDLLDVGRSGHITPANFAKGLREVGNLLTPEQASFLLDKLTKNRRDITKEEFITVMSRKAF